MHNIIIKSTTENYTPNTKLN